MILTTALPIALGCARQPMPLTVIAPSDGPMEVRLFQTGTGALNYYVSESAHVALFELLPDRARLLFPNYEQERTHIARAGVNVVRLGRASRRPFSPSAPAYSITSPARPRYFLIIASKSPLRLDGIRLSMARQAQRFPAARPAGMVSYLESSAAGGMTDKEWSSHLYLIYPVPSYPLCDGVRGASEPVDTRSLAWRFPCRSR
jgi:hypothetical protein